MGDYPKALSPIEGEWSCNVIAWSLWFELVSCSKYRIETQLKLHKDNLLVATKEAVAHPIMVS